MLSIEKQVLFLLSRSNEMETQELIRIYEQRNYSAPTIRNALSHLKKNGYAISPARSLYAITDSGRAFIHTINQKPLLYDREWDGQFHLVMTQIPEAERKKRDRFRLDMRQAGFGLLHHSVYIAPWNYKEEVAELLNRHEISEASTQLIGRLQGRTIEAPEASEIWELSGVQQEYARLYAWYSSEFSPGLTALLHASQAPEPLALFTRFLQLGEVISALYLIDPMLPQALLPEDWPCRRILGELRSALQQLAGAIPADSPYARFL